MVKDRGVFFTATGSEAITKDLEDLGSILQRRLSKAITLSPCSLIPLVYNVHAHFHTLYALESQGNVVSMQPTLASLRHVILAAHHHLDLLPHFR